MLRGQPFDSTVQSLPTSLFPYSVGWEGSRGRGQRKAVLGRAGAEKGTIRAGGSASVWPSESFVIALGGPVAAAGRKEGVHCLYLFFFFINSNPSDLCRRRK